MVSLNSQLAWDPASVSPEAEITGGSCAIGSQLVSATSSLAPRAVLPAPEAVSCLPRSPGPTLCFETGSQNTDST